ncbi:MAG: tRNA (N6-isopentenyl adenosine(37)-C2)-methylthiotransferase MiaB [Coriobacteriia bacterium]|nr:tRNA (N6-isopentenyl adenosine(37)-C2)-methylthiotransferase MiaB [Coriobacteriia bacterium]
MNIDFNEVRFCIHTFGCQMNKHDSERVVGMLEALGAMQVEAVEDADVVIFMTCCVREAADVRLRGQVNSMKNIPVRAGSPTGRRHVAIGGCIGQRDGEALVRELPNVDVVFGTMNLASLPRLIADAMNDGAAQVEVLEKSDDFPTSLPSHREKNWSAWLPITIGCNNFCSYCIVPYVRGREKSRPLEDIKKEARGLVLAGAKEITLLGQNVNSYGRDLYGEARFAEVLDAVHESGVRYLRFATSHPKDLNDQVIERIGSLERVAPALHLAVQSGSDRILKAMNRRYTAEHYLGLVDKVRAARPDIALSTDIIVGFPGETEEDFQATYDLVEAVGYTQVFTFIYSPREGTPAAKMPYDIPREVIQDRFDRLRDLVERKAWEANRLDQGKRIEVLVESVNRKDADAVSGRSPKNQNVHVSLPKGEDPESLVGSVVQAQVTDARPWFLRAEFAGVVER